MWAYILRRLLYAVPILLGVSMLVFALIHLAPGDVVDILVPPEVPREVADSAAPPLRASTSRSTSSIWPGSGACWSAISASRSSPTGRWRTSCSARSAIR